MTLIAKKCSFIIGLFVLATVGLSGCASNQTKSGASSSEQDVASESEQTFVSKFPSKALLEFANDVELELIRGNGRSLVNRVDMSLFLYRGKRSYQANTFSLEALQGDTPAKYIQSLLINQLSDLRNHYKQITLVHKDVEHSKLLYRLNRNRLDYLEVYYRKNYKGDYRIIDFRRWLSVMPESTRLTRIAMLSEASKKGKSRKATSTNWNKLPKILKKSNAKEIKTFFDELYTEGREVQFLQLLEVSTLLTNTKDDNEYKKRLSFLDLQRQPLSDVLWLAAYHSSSDPHLSVKIVDKVLKNEYGDAAIYQYRSEQELRIKQFDNALNSAYQALSVDPEYQPAYWTLAAELARRNELDMAWDALRVLRKRFGRLITKNTLSRTPLYKALLEKPEFQDWLNNPT
ncbi:tetratricopeptide repeat protein [Marinomonas mediterranea]|jgi:hypothetical protein|uniref:Uncharacterized protein n=1 Tax=Marinomonas mediterranea (strain ATCC 700492 / JCM 21426 / NBRC 103028 / MMB-1) TaxID=717774 RepID=F2JUM2_MARM1|nr:hypothetical protein [Marinomonas mediterranea]ADZ89355.1 hypothetical protein Marme_0049 [Marinomonas mediterranea MMB-1]WCN15620.1 hypothetical protein GV053_00240 [Marinomonas mediterranea MMB-1]